MAIPTVEQVDANSPVNEILMKEGYRDNLGLLQGMVTPWYDFNSTLSVPAAYMLCNGDQITETNYDAIHGAGKWAEDIVTTVLEDLYTPDMVAKYPVGIATTQAGTVAITSEGNADHEIDIEHSHDHNHKWYDGKADGVHDQTFNSGGSGFNLGPNSKTGGFFGIPISANNMGENTDGYTNDDATTELSTTQDIQPESIGMKFLIKIV